VTHVERLARPSTQWLARGLKKSRWYLTTLVSVAVSLSTVTILTHPAGAMTVEQEKARAATLYTQIQNVNNEAQALGQKFDLAQGKLNQIKNTIVNTKAIVKGIQSKVGTDNSQLKADAIFAYVTNGAATGNNPLFTSNAANAGATDVYNQLAQGNIGSVIASLKSNRVELTQERGVLAAELSQAQIVNNAAASALQQANTLEANIKAARSQVEGQISAYYNAIAAAAAAASARAVTTAVATPTPGLTPAPGPDALGEAAVAAAETFLGPPATWYEWGGASRSGVDCSGLVMLAYDAVGVSLPHYSGGQFDDTERVPLWDIQPGDLLFYGYNGDDHVAMYIGGGNMIEAPETGYQVHITPIRLGYGFAGIGRVRA
jgi:cell wall-associated NlpC family hydrolase